MARPERHLDDPDGHTRVTSADDVDYCQYDGEDWPCPYLVEKWAAQEADRPGPAADTVDGAGPVSVERHGGPPVGRHGGRSGRWGFVRGPITAAQEREIAAAPTVWRRPICQAVAWYQTHPRPGSLVHPRWVPVQWLVDLFDGHLDTDTLVAVIVAMDRDGALTQRTLRIDGVDYPVVTIEEPPLPTGHALLPGGVRLALDAPKETR